MSVVYKIPKYSGADEVVDLAAAKVHLRIEHDDEDADIQQIIDSAMSEVESYIGGPVLERTGVEFGLSGWQTNTKFPTGPVTEITSVEYLKSGEESYSTLDTSFYKLYNFGTTSQQIVIREAGQTESLEEETLDAVKITAKVGWPLNDVPEDIKKALLLIIDDAYTFRGEKELKINRSSRNLLRPYKQF